MKRGSIFFISLLMLLGVIILFLLIGKFGINGYVSYENLEGEKSAGITGNSLFDNIKESFGFGNEEIKRQETLQSSPSLTSYDKISAEKSEDLEGTYELIVIDDFKNKKAEYLHYINTQTGRYKLNTPYQRIDLTSGKKIKVRGKVKESAASSRIGEIDVESFSLADSQGGDGGQVASVNPI